MGKQAICKAISKLSKKFLAPKLLQAPAAAGSVRAGSTHRPLLLAAHDWEMLGSCIQHVGLLGATYPMCSTGWGVVPLHKRRSTTEVADPEGQRWGAAALLLCSGLYLGIQQLGVSQLGKQCVPGS